MVKQSGKSDTWRDLLQARALQIDETAIEAYCKDHAVVHELEDWINTYAQPATLLSQEELVFSRQVNLASKGRSSTDAITDEAFEDAVSSLQATIEGIEQQCKVLEEHKQALTLLKAQHISTEKSDLRSQNSQKSVREGVRLELDNDRLAADLRKQVDSHDLKVAAILGNASNCISKTLEKDDRILDGLRKVMPRLDANDDERLSTEAVDALCEQWVSLERQAMRRRVDNAYEIALKKTLDPTDVSTSINGTAEHRAVRAELAELSGEIDGLVTLVAEHHYRALIKRSLTQARIDAEAESTKWSEYTACVLLFLTARLEALHELYEHSHVHRASFNSLLNELSGITTIKTSKESQNGRVPEPLHTGRGLKPLRLVQATFNDSHETTAQIFKLLDVSISETPEDSTIHRILNDALHERATSSSTRLRESDEIQARAIAQSIELQRNHFRSLFDAIQDQPATGYRKLGVKKRLAVFEAQTDVLAGEMQSLDIEAIVRDVAM